MTLLSKTRVYINTVIKMKLNAHCLQNSYFLQHFIQLYRTDIQFSPIIPQRFFFGGTN